MQCVICNKTIENKRKGAKYCSAACQQIAYRLRRSQGVLRNEELRTYLSFCKHCNAPIVSVTRRQKHYCNDHCKTEARKARKLNQWWFNVWHYEMKGVPNFDYDTTKVFHKGRYCEVTAIWSWGALELAEFVDATTDAKLYVFSWWGGGSSISGALAWHEVPKRAWVLKGHVGYDENGNPPAPLY